MFKQSIIASATFALAVSANAAPQWVELSHSLADLSFLDHSSINPQGRYVDVEILRNYDETVVLGNDPASGAEMYSHRSVKLEYRFDCDSRKQALTGWKMYAGTFGHGEVVWADNNWGEPAFVDATDEEARSVLIAACTTATAAR